MPNWCSNSMVVYGSPTEIKDFYNKIQNAWKKGDKSKQWHLYQIYEEFGYEKEEILKSDRLGYIRGYFIDITEIEKPNDKEWYFSLYYDSAWGSMYEGFDLILKENYKTLKEETLAEETGCEVFINTDIHHKFFPEKYYLYVEDEDTYYCESDKEVVNIVNELLGSKAMRNINQCFNLLKKTKNMIKDKYVCLYEYGPRY